MVYIIHSGEMRIRSMFLFVNFAFMPLFSIIIIITVIPLYFKFSHRDLSEYYCPRCKSYNIEELEMGIRCNDCGLTFPLDIINSDIDEDDILADEELESFVNAFKELEDEDTWKKFKDSLDEDFPVE